MAAPVNKERDYDTPMGYMRTLRRQAYDTVKPLQVPSATGGRPPAEIDENNQYKPTVIEPNPRYNGPDALPIMPRLKGPSANFKAEDYDITNAGFVKTIADTLTASMEDPAVKAAIGDEPDINRFALDLVGYMQRSFEAPTEPVPLPDQVAMTRTALRVHNWLNKLNQRRLGAQYG